MLGLGFPEGAKPLRVSRPCKASRGMEHGQGVHTHTQEMWSSACCEQPGEFRTFWLSGCCFLWWADDIFPPQGLQPRVLMGAELGLGKDQGLKEDQEKGTRMLV